MDRLNIVILKSPKSLIDSIFFNNFTLPPDKICYLEFLGILNSCYAMTYSKCIYSAQISKY